MLCFFVGQTQEIIRGYVKIARNRDDVAAWYLLDILLVFAYLLLGGVEKLGYLLLACFSGSGFFQSGSDIRDHHLLWVSIYVYYFC